MRAFLAVLVVFSALLGMANSQGLGAELSNLDFESIIGSPLQAVIQAQAMSAKATVDFITQVGFENATNSVKMVQFQYSKFDNGTTNTYTLTVPFILMMPIPYIEVQEMTIDLNVKINQVQTTESDSSLNVYSEISGSAKYWFVKVNFKAGFSYTSNTKTTGMVQRDYALAVHVEASQAGMPKGTERILDIMEAIIKELPTSENNEVTP